jgi:hypothetical protein
MDVVLKYQFRKIVACHNGNYRVRRFTCWNQFLCLCFGQLTFRESLRVIVAILDALSSRHYHMVIKTIVAHNTFSRANTNRLWQIYQGLAMVLIDQARRACKDEGELDSTRDSIYALDSTTIDLCLSLFPWAKFVHLIRDGRDVCLSATTWHQVARLERRFPSWREDPVTTAALWWELHVRVAREAGMRLEPTLYREMRYEQLVADPPEELKALCAFLSLGYSEAMPRFHEGRTRTDPGLGSNKRWLPPTAGLRNWRTQMPSHDAELFEATAGNLLEELDYPRAFSSVSAEVQERVARVREVFTKDLRGRGWPLPERWAA